MKEMNIERIKGTNLSRVYRDMERSKEDFLYYLFNKLGAYNLRLAYSYHKDGQLRFSRWIYYRELMHLNYYDFVPRTRDTREEFVAKISHRSILDIEVVLDIDDKGKYKSIKNKARAVCRKLDKFGMVYSCYFTGSKSYHISLLFHELKQHPKHERKDLKGYILTWLGADGQKCSEDTLIALEGERHYKSGLRKVEVVL